MRRNLWSKTPLLVRRANDVTIHVKINTRPFYQVGRRSFTVQEINLVDAGHTV
jgi:hypothetical protein